MEKIRAERNESDISLELESVVCVYCGQVMGWTGSKSAIDPETHSVKVVGVMEDNPNLLPICEASPDRLHANMTPEQAKAQGFL